MKLIAVIASVVLFITFCSETYGQEISFKQVEGNNGESLGQINSITQDPHGYMWFSGQGASCIYRYDGVRMIAFRHDSLNENSLGGINTETVYADSKGIIWIGFFDDGIDSYNPSTGLFKHYRNNPQDSNSISKGKVSAILKDRSGRLWIGTQNGLDELNEKTGKFIHYRNIPGNSSSLSCNFIRAIYEDHQGILWIGTGYEFTSTNTYDSTGGLNRMESNGTFTRFLHDPNNPKSLISNKVRAIFEDSRNIFWIGTTGDGLHTMDRRTGEFERHTYEPLHPDQLSRPALKNNGINDPITFIREDANGSIWIGTYQSGINRYDTTTKKITHYESSKGYPDKSCWTAFKSRDGVLWLSSTDQGGFLFRADHIINELRNILTPQLVTSLYEDKQETLWAFSIATGLLEYDKNKRLVYEYKTDADSTIMEAGNVISICQYNEDTLLLGTGGGILVLNKKTQHITRLGYKAPSDLTTKKFTNEVVDRIIKDKNGIIWMATFNGLWQLNSENLLLKKYLHDAKDTTTISSNKLTSVLEDHEGNIWASSGDKTSALAPYAFIHRKGGGINRLNKTTGTFVHYLNETNILCLTADAEGNVWAGSSGNGLYVFNKKADRFDKFLDSEIDLHKESVVNILDDDHHNLWVVTTSFIIRMNADRKSYFIYGKKYGIRSNTLRFGAICKTSKGEIIVGNNNGFYVLSPNDVLIRGEPLQVNVTDFSINNHPVYVSKESVLKKPIEDIKEITLKYNQNNLSFNFAAVDYRAPEATKYYTLLENFDSIWRDAGGDKSANYINMPPGNYTFHIKAVNIDGISAGKKIQIIILPPWWETWWFRIISVIAMVAVVYAIVQNHSRKLKKQNLQLEELVMHRTKELKHSLEELQSTQAQLIQQEKMASLGELTAGIAHEIQNPLNFVNNFSEVNKEMLEELKAERVKPNADKTLEDDLINDLIANEEKINHHGKRADAIVKGMLQHSRKSEGKKEPIDINALCDEYLRLSYHGMRAKDKNFNADFTTDFDNSIGKIKIVPQDVGRVLLNLYNNAFYAVNEKKKSYEQSAVSYEPIISIQTKRLNNSVEIKVSDNGNGIPQNIIDKIFQPFFTTKPTGEGTGLGLSLAYDIITKEHNGTIKAESIEGEGTVFIIQLINA